MRGFAADFVSRNIVGVAFPTLKRWANIRCAYGAGFGASPQGASAGGAVRRAARKPERAADKGRDQGFGKRDSFRRAELRFVLSHPSPEFQEAGPSTPIAALRSLRMTARMGHPFSWWRKRAKGQLRMRSTTRGGRVRRATARRARRRGGSTCDAQAGARRLEKRGRGNFTRSEPWPDPRSHRSSGYRRGRISWRP